MFGRRRNEQRRRAEDVRKALKQFDSCNLVAQTPEQLLELSKLLDHANKTCWEILNEHDDRAPSAIWLHINVWTGLGGLALIDPTFISLIITAGGVLGAGKSVYDRGAHLVQEQSYLGLFWSVQHRKNNLQSVLRNRGIL